MDYPALSRYFEPPAAPGERWALPGSLMLAAALGAALVWASRPPSRPIQAGLTVDVIFSSTLQQAGAAPPPPPPPEPTAKAEAPAPKAPPPPAEPKSSGPVREADIGTQKRIKDKEPKKEPPERDRAQKERAQKEAADKAELEQQKLAQKIFEDTLRRNREAAPAPAAKAEAKAAAPAKPIAPPAAPAPVAPAAQAKPQPPAAAAPPAVANKPQPVVRPQATGTGAGSDKGAASQSSGPTASYAGKIIHLVRENTFFNEPNLSQYTVVVIVRADANGQITKAEIKETSGRPAFDDAVLRGIRKMKELPKDVDGRIPELVLREGMEITIPFNR